MIYNTENKFGFVAKFFHWVMFSLFIIMFPLGYIMTSLSKSEFKYSLYGFHKATGLILLSLITMRLIWRFINTQPHLSQSIPQWQRQMAKTNIIVLYFFMFAMPMTGFLTSTLGGHDISFYGLFNITPIWTNEQGSEWCANLHAYFSYLMLAAFAVHVIGAIYHHFILKDDVLRRISIN